MITIKRHAYPLHPDPLGRKIPRHSGRTGQHIPSCNFVGLAEDGELLPKEPRSAPSCAAKGSTKNERPKKVVGTGQLICSKCGKAFIREVKRGRPAVKCPNCRA